LMQLRRLTFLLVFSVLQVICFAVLRSPKLAGVNFSSTTNLGAPINTQWREGEQAFADDGTMVYTSQRADMSIDGRVQFDMYLSSRDKHTGKYAEPVNMGPLINSPYNDQEPWITPDGNTIIFRSARPTEKYQTDCGPNNQTACGYLWETHKVNGTWSLAQLLPSPINANGVFNHCPMFLRDGKTLCFASDRPGGYGGWDLWCAERHKEGYSDAVNLGPNINSAGNELHFYPDVQGQWVYFTSNKPGGLGSFDIYATTWHANIGEWAQGINLGPSVNTPDSDQCSSITPDGKSMLFFSNRPGGVGTYPHDSDVYSAQFV